MAQRQRTRALLSFSILFFVTATCLAKDWVRYVNRQSGYSLNYPNSWYRFNEESARFDLLNFPPEQRIKGVVLKANGAEILVTPQPKNNPQSLNDWIKSDLAHDQLIESRDISPAKKSREGCDRLQQVVSHSEEGPGVHFINTSLYCISKRRSVQILLSNWEGDPSQSSYQAIAAKIANSIRLF